MGVDQLKPELTEELKDRAQDYPGVWRWVRYSNPPGTDPEALREELRRKLDDLDRGMSDTVEFFHDFRKAEKREKRRAEKRLRLIFQWPRPGYDWMAGDLVRHQLSTHNYRYGLVEKVSPNGKDLHVLATGTQEVEVWDGTQCKLVRRG